MPEILAVGPRPPSRMALFGQALGQNISTGMDKERQLMELEARYNPMREALLQQLGTSATTPGQQMLANIAKDPRAFAEVMQDPQKILSMQGAAEMMAPPVPVKQERAPVGGIDEFMQTVQLEREYRERGETDVADRLAQRIEKLVDDGAMDPLIERGLAMGMTLGSPEFNEFIMTNTGSKPAETNIYTGSVTDDATKKYQEGVGTRAEQRLVLADSARAQQSQLDRMKVALDEGVTTGAGQQTLLNVKNLAQSLFGVELPPEAAEQEVMRSLQTQLMLQIRNPDSGMGLPGASSNKDIVLLSSGVPGLGMTMEGNRKLIDYMTGLNRLKIATAQEQQRILDANDGKIPTNLESQIADFVSNFELFTPEERARLEAAPTETPAPAATDDVVARARAQLGGQ